MPPIVSDPSATATVPSASTQRTPASSIRSTSGVNRPWIREAASSASTTPSFWRRKRSLIARWELVAWISGAFEKVSSAIELSDPTRRRFSREARLTRREKCLADEPERRHDHQRDQRQAPVEQEQGGAEEEDPQERREAVGDPGEDEGLDLLHVARDPGDEVAEAVTVEDVEREPLDVVEHAEPQREQEALRDPGPEVVVGERDRRAEQGQAEVERAAIQPRAPRSPGTSTSSTTSLKAQISAVSISAPSAIATSSTGSQRR